MTWIKDKIVYFIVGLCALLGANWALRAKSNRVSQPRPLPSTSGHEAMKQALENQSMQDELKFDATSLEIDDAVEQAREKIKEIDSDHIDDLLKRFDDLGF